MTPAKITWRPSIYLMDGLAGVLVVAFGGPAQSQGQRTTVTVDTVAPDCSVRLALRTMGRFARRGR